MRFTVSAIKVHELVENTCQQLGITLQKSSQKVWIELPRVIGKGWVQRHQLRSGLELSICNATVWETTIREIQLPHELRLIGLDFCLKGQCRRTRSGVHQDFILHYNQSHWGFSAGISGTDEWLGREHTILVEISLEPETIKNLVGEELEYLPNSLQQFIEGTHDGWHSQIDPMALWMRTALEQILNCPYQGTSQRLYLEAKVLELIAGYLEQMRTKQSASKPLIQLRPEDVDRLHQAKEILTMQLLNPPSLGELSQQVNLNLKKLNLGFRELFGTTPFGYLTEHRMEQARILLETRNLNVTEVSRVVGYASLSAFNVAFRKRFGVNPSTVCGK